MSVFEQIRSNQVLVSACLGWLVAQILKTLIDMWATGSFKLERMYGNGGMPSSHSATVCALMTSAAFRYGLSSFEFAISFILGLVVMVDAMGVRRETGKQAKLLNMMMEQDFWKFDDPVVFEKKLKEFIGHTPLQVVCGAVLGVVVACIAETVLFG
jgi:acid phosphatase family membrane protein YuiD